MTYQFISNLLFILTASLVVWYLWGKAIKLSNRMLNILNHIDERVCLMSKDIPKELTPIYDVSYSEILDRIAYPYEDAIKNAVLYCSLEQYFYLRKLIDGTGSKCIYEINGKKYISGLKLVVIEEGDVKGIDGIELISEQLGIVRHCKHCKGKK